MGRILIVDDEPHMRRVLAVNLREQQHAVKESAGGGRPVKASGPKTSTSSSLTRKCLMVRASKC